jgi:hypothetical protein
MQATWTNPDQVSVQKILHKIFFIGNDKISEIVNDSDLDGGNFSELSDNMCEVNSPFSSSSSSNSSSSEEEEVIQPEPGTGRKTRRALPKRTDTYFELGWKEQIQMVQKPAFTGVPGINRNFNINQDSYPMGYISNILQPRNVQTYAEGDKPICNAANKQKEARGPSDTQNLYLHSGIKSHCKK